MDIQNNHILKGDTEIHLKMLNFRGVDGFSSPGPTSWVRKTCFFDVFSKKSQFTIYTEIPWCFFVARILFVKTRPPKSDKHTLRGKLQVLVDQGTFTHEDTQEDPKEGDGQVNSQQRNKTPQVNTLPEAHKSPLKIDGWKMNFLLRPGSFSSSYVSLMGPQNLVNLKKRSKKPSLQFFNASV